MAQDGKITLTLNDDSNEINVTVPVFTYNTTIQYPWSIVELENGAYSFWDDGGAYDKRWCDVEFEIAGADVDTLMTYIKSTGRADNDLKLTMSSGSGFHPFGPDKGDEGTFEISLIMRKFPRQVMEPFKYFLGEFRMINTGAYPAYTPPSEVDEGEFQFGTVTDCRFPISWFGANERTGVYDTLEEDSEVQYIDRGSGDEQDTTEFDWLMNESKCAAVLSYINTNRTTQFNIVAGTDFYPFGRELGGNGTFPVRMINNVLKIKHDNYNRYNISGIKLVYVK